MTDQRITARSAIDNDLDAQTEASSGAGDSGDKPELDDRMKTMYRRFGAMIATSTVAMFVLMYFNTYEWDHVQWSETRFYMALVMVSTMAVRSARRQNSTPGRCPNSMSPTVATKCRVSSCR